MFGDYSLGELGSILVMQGLCRADPVLGVPAHGARTRDHLRPDGRDQHGARGVHDPRRLHDLFVLAPVRDLFPRPVQRLLLLRDGGRVRRVRGARPPGRMAAHPSSLCASARHPARHLGPEPDHAAGVPLDLRRARGRRRIAAVDDGLAPRHRHDRGADQRPVRHGFDAHHHRRSSPCCFTGRAGACRCARWSRTAP